MGFFTNKNKPDESLHEDPVPAYSESSAAPSTSTLPPSSTPFQTRFASLSLHSEDRIRLLHFPTPIISLCGETINAVWKRGIQSQRPYDNSHEFKLSGYPWRGNEAMDARRLVCALLRVLHGEGWVLTLNTDVSKSICDKDTLLFRWQNSAPAECEWASIAFSKTDRIRFIDLPPEISRVVASKIEHGMVKEQCNYMPGVEEIKFSSSLWYANGTDTMKVREILLILLETLEEEGWSVYASVNQKNGGQNYTETDTWHLCKPKDWTKGTPVYHK